jgi:hypothetical protein
MRETGCDPFQGSVLHSYWLVHSIWAYTDTVTAEFFFFFFFFRPSDLFPTIINLKLFCLQTPWTGDQAVATPLQRSLGLKINDDNTEHYISTMYKVDAGVYYKAIPQHSPRGMRNTTDYHRIIDPSAGNQIWYCRK